MYVLPFLHNTASYSSLSCPVLFIKVRFHISSGAYFLGFLNLDLCCCYFLPPQSHFLSYEISQNSTGILHHAALDTWISLEHYYRTPWLQSSVLHLSYVCAKQSYFFFFLSSLTFNYPLSSPRSLPRPLDWPNCFSFVRNIHVYLHHSIFLLQ